MNVISNIRKYAVMALLCAKKRNPESLRPLNMDVIRKIGKYIWESRFVDLILDE